MIGCRPYTTRLMVPRERKRTAPGRERRPHSRRGREISQRRRVAAGGNRNRRWSRRGIRACRRRRRHDIEYRVGLTATEQGDHDVEWALALLLSRLEQRGQHRLGVCTVLGSVAAPVLARADQRADCALGRRMPRAGLCRVGVNRTPSFAADHAFAFAGVSA